MPAGLTAAERSRASRILRILVRSLRDDGFAAVAGGEGAE